MRSSARSGIRNASGPSRPAAVESHRFIITACAAMRRAGSVLSGPCPCRPLRTRRRARRPCRRPHRLRLRAAASRAGIGSRRTLLRVRLLGDVRRLPANASRLLLDHVPVVALDHGLQVRTPRIPPSARSAGETLSPRSLSAFSVACSRPSARLRVSASSRNFVSSSACASASRDHPLDLVLGQAASRP